MSLALNLNCSSLFQRLDLVCPMRRHTHKSPKQRATGPAALWLGIPLYGSPTTSLVTRAFFLPFAVVELGCCHLLQAPVQCTYSAVPSSLSVAKRARRPGASSSSLRISQRRTRRLLMACRLTRSQCSTSSAFLVARCRVDAQLCILESYNSCVFYK